MSSKLPTFAENDFRKATASGPNQNCVCIAHQDGHVAIRDSKTTFGSPADHHLHLTAPQFTALLTALRAE